MLGGGPPTAVALQQVEASSPLIIQVRMFWQGAPCSHHLEHQVPPLACSGLGNIEHKGALILHKKIHQPHMAQLLFGHILPHTMWAGV